jgi:RES domain-containing protein
VLLWRLCRRKHARRPLDGKGAERYGGRWNGKGTRLVYCSSTLSLAVLEHLVHVNADLMPGDLVSIALDLPDSASIKTIKISDLPKNWRTYPAAPALCKLGSAWAAAQESLALCVPSAVVPMERNYLLNPTHKDIAKVRVRKIEPFKFDPRLIGRKP